MRNLDLEKEVTPASVLEFVTAHSSPRGMRLLCLQQWMEYQVAKKPAPMAPSEAKAEKPKKISKKAA
jgi:hypothetical protein